MNRLVSCVVLAVLVPACGGCSYTSRSSSTTAAETESATSPGESIPWAKKNREQRIEHMKKVVLPTMGPLFTEFDGERYPKPECKLCHGTGAKDGTFVMPNPELPVMDFSSPDFPEYAKKHGAVLNFMKSTVWPEAAKAIGIEPQSKDNPTGFSCHSCHPGASGK